MAYTAAFGQLLAGLLAMSMALTSLTMAVPLYERTRPILEALPEVDDTKADPGELRGHIEMDHVTFSYDPEAPPTIRDLTLDVLPGEFVAIVGPSGAGKSTLFRLLLGFDAPESGEIHFDGQDLRTLDLGALRRQVSTVLQNGRVFSGSVQMNIAGAAQLTQDEIWEAATAAGLADDIEAMPMGMFTYVAEGGVTLSGGQRQRLLIARALSTKPPSCCSTRPRARWTTARRRSSCAASRSSTPRAWSSPSDSAPSAPQTASTCSRTAAWPRSAASTSS